MALENLNPKNVFKYFEEICNIPRGSKNENQISNYLVDFAKNHNLEYIQDKYLNVIIKKTATKGYENSDCVILQGHMDMVCEKNSSTNHNFLIDPIKPRVINDMVYATDTTLGADNGLAVAYCLAVLEADNIPHPPLEVLITTEEEVGMGGAMNLDPSLLSGKYLINIDSEEEGSLLVSCCGGIKTQISLNYTKENIKENYQGYTIFIKGLKGGHSGMDIIKQRGNANKLIGRILSKLLIDNIDFSIANINGGSKSNAIPRECNCEIIVSLNDCNKLKEIVNSMEKEFKNELDSIDDVNISLNENNNINEVFTKDVTEKVITILSLIENGVDTMSPFIENLPQSSNNIGVVQTTETSILFESSIRSSVASVKEDILNKHRILAKTVDGEIYTEGDYPEWQFAKESHLRDVFENVFSNMFNKKPIIAAIHAGLECGILKEKLPHLDLISFGPDHFDVHSPNEHLSIPSTERMWNYLLEVLKELK